MKSNQLLAVLVIPRLMTLCCQVQASPISMTMVSEGPQQMLSDALARCDRAPGGWGPRLTR